MAEQGEAIAPTEEEFELPVTEVLTGRGAVFGKSGSGKSNTVTVVLEELLERDLSFLVVDSDGEYFGLKEEYEVVRAGADEVCDLQVDPEDANALAELALERDVPVILDLSGYLDNEVVQALVKNTLESLFHKERKQRKPFLAVLEEVHEYIPQSGGTDDVAETVVRVAKRGRKRGLGVLGVSQRPAAVDKDFITQCNWLVWHRLTWNNDVDVVRSHLGSDYADRVEHLDAGDAFMQCDWVNSVEFVHFRLKETFDAGATPGFEDYTPPDLKPVRQEVIDAFRSTRPGSSTRSSTETETEESSLPDIEWDAEVAEEEVPPDEAVEETPPDGAVEEIPPDGAVEETPPDVAGEAGDDADGEAGGESDTAGTADDEAAPPATDDAAADGADSDGAANDGDVGNNTGGTARATPDVPETHPTANTVPAPAEAEAVASQTTTAPNADKRDDMVWELGQFVAYVVERTVIRTRRGARRLRDWTGTHARRAGRKLRDVAGGRTN